MKYIIIILSSSNVSLRQRDEVNRQLFQASGPFAPLPKARIPPYASWRLQIAEAVEDIVHKAASKLTFQVFVGASGTIQMNMGN